MTRILFICHGNICRSPMAEFVMKDLVARAGLSEAFEIASAATSREEIGNGVYPPARRELARHGIRCDGHRARQLTAEDYRRYDYLLVMDDANLRNAQRICGGDRPGEVADPWYTGNFEATWQDVLEGCEALLELTRPT